MGTYFNGSSEIQGADGLQTLVLMNPGHFQYSGASTPPATGNFVFHAPPQQTQQFVGIPLASHQQDHNSQSHHEMLAPRVQYNLWKPVDAAARESPRAQQGLSLSLFSQQHGQAGFGSFAGNREAVPAKLPPLAVAGGSPATGVVNGFSGMQSVLMSSKYLKAAQELLDEVVNVGNNNGVRPDPTKKSPNGQSRAAGESSADGSVTAEASGKTTAELSTVEKQEIQMKKAKLINMLDEVEQRYRQYHHQMQIVTTSFEQVAGAGSARTYTALALKTISKQFRCLRDAITGQIRGASKSLGEEDCVGGGKIGGSRLKFVDHQLRQQRALQQLGMSQQNAWRPQRGLPERAVSVLRAWLFEHFLHPYPKDSDKHMLAKQTGLTRSQVSNWFINARVRLWKPMVEEMYVEELKDQDHNVTEDKTLPKSENINEDSSDQDKSSGAGNMMNSNHDVPSLMGGNVQNQSVFTLTGSSELEGITQGSPKKPRAMDMVPRDEYSAMAGGPANFIGGFGQYPIGEIRRFDAEQYTPRFSGNGVSLTLGLPHGENLPTHQGFLPNPNMDQLGEPDEFGNVMNTPGSTYESIDIQRRKRFAAQLLPDFVA